MCLAPPCRSNSAVATDRGCDVVTDMECTHDISAGSAPNLPGILRSTFATRACAWPRRLPFHTLVTRFPLTASLLVGQICADDTETAVALIQMHWKRSFIRKIVKKVNECHDIIRIWQDTMEFHCDRLSLCRWRARQAAQRWDALISDGSDQDRSPFLRHLRCSRDQYDDGSFALPESCFDLIALVKVLVCNTTTRKIDVDTRVVHTNGMSEQHRGLYHNSSFAMTMDAFAVKTPLTFVYDVFFKCEFIGGVVIAKYEIDWLGEWGIAVEVLAMKHTPGTTVLSESDKEKMLLNVLKALALADCPSGSPCYLFGQKFVDGWQVNDMISTSLVQQSNQHRFTPTWFGNATYLLDITPP